MVVSVLSTPLVLRFTDRSLYQLALMSHYDIIRFLQSQSYQLIDAIIIYASNRDFTRDALSNFDDF